MPSKTKSGGGRKHGRDATKCQKYRAAGIRERNKARRIAKEKRRQTRLKERKERIKAEREKKLYGNKGVEKGKSTK